MSDEEKTTTVMKVRAHSNMYAKGEQPYNAIYAGNTPYLQH